MSNYGITDEGFSIKRMNDVMTEVHSDLSKGFGFDTSQGPSRFLDVLVTTFSNQIAEIWEELQDTYYAMYPSTATGKNLDYAGQFLGIKREEQQQSLYKIHCTGLDETTIPSGTVIQTSTNPSVRLYNKSEGVITSTECNSLNIRVANVESGTYYISIGSETYEISNTSDTDTDILNALLEAIDCDGIIMSIDEDNDYNVLHIEQSDEATTMVVEMSANLTTTSVTSIIAFYTEDYGKIVLADNVVTKIVTSTEGFKSCNNVITPIYGREEETDDEYRLSYIAKSMIRSQTMVESITSELLENVGGVETATGHSNDTDEEDENGLLPHSVEIIVEGGDDYEIAEAILRKKAGGIATNGSEYVEVEGIYGDVIPIRFNRPQKLYTWIKVELTGTHLPSNYEDVVKESVLNFVSNLSAGDDLLIQKVDNEIYNAMAGVTFVDISVAYSTESDYTPQASDYEVSNVVATLRQAVVTSESMIEVTV